MSKLHAKNLKKDQFFFEKTEQMQCITTPQNTKENVWEFIAIEVKTKKSVAYYIDYNFPQYAPKISLTKDYD